MCIRDSLPVLHVSRSYYLVASTDITVMKSFPGFSLLLILTCYSLDSFSQKEDLAIKHIDANTTAYAEAAMQIWNFAELGYQEYQSSALLQKTLKDAGFTITTGVAGMPTAFIAEYGSGHPVIGICLLYTSPSPRDRTRSRMPSSA